MSAIDTGRRRFLRTAGAAAAAAGLSGGGFAVGRMSGTTTEAAGTPAPTGLPFAFRTGGYRAALDVPEGMQPWRTRTAERTDSGQHDAAGVRMFRAHGRLHDHPVGQIQYGLENLASHRRTGDAFFLRRARAQADRVIRRRHQARGAWFFPYPFDFSHAVHKGVAYRAPWYSGMAQGEALSLFSQLARNTGVPSADRAQYRTAADKAFASLLVGNDKGPWVVARDERDHLWIHEYPIEAPGTSDYTYNGFMFAALGLWDYYAMSRNPLAEQLFDGSLTTLHAYFPDLRNPGRLSHYCRTHEIPTVHYHPVHIDLLLQLSWLSGSERFAAHADLLMEDYPPPSLGASGGRVTLQDGTHTLFRFTEEGAVTATRRLHLRRPRQFTASRRTRVMGHGIHYLLTDGPEAEWYVAERFPAVRLHGEWCGTDYRPARRAVFQAGVSVICHASPTVNAAPRTVTYPKDTPVYYNRRALVEGRSMVRLTDGPSAGWWAPTAQLLMPGAS